LRRAELNILKIRKVSCVDSASGSEVKSFSLSDLQDSLQGYVKESTERLLLKIFLIWLFIVDSFTYPCRESCRSLKEKLLTSDPLAVQGYVKESTINNQIKNILSNSLSEAVFSDKAILLEGTTDHACVKGIVDSFFGSNYFERLGINYVVCGSKTNILYS
jgi:hypothetical protein